MGAHENENRENSEVFDSDNDDESLDVDGNVNDDDEEESEEEEKWEGEEFIRRQRDFCRFIAGETRQRNGVANSLLVARAPPQYQGKPVSNFAKHSSTAKISG